MQGTIGDTIVGVPALSALRRHFGESATLVILHDLHDHLVSTPKTVLGELGVVDSFISYPFSQYLGARWRCGIRLWWQLTRMQFDVLFYLVAADREARQIARDRFFFRMCGIRQLYGFRFFKEAEVRPCAVDGALPVVQHEALNRLRLVEEAGVDINRESSMLTPFFEAPACAQKEADDWLETHGVNAREATLIAVAPGAKKTSCLWPLHCFARIGKEFKHGWNASLVIVGGSAEKDLGVALTEAWNGGLNACGQLSVLGTAALLKRSKLLIGLDTGTTHLAAAVGTPCVSLYSGQDWPGRWDPIGEGHVVIRHPVSCAGCRLINCSVPGHPCMTGIKVEEVIAVVTRRLREVVEGINTKKVERCVSTKQIRCAE